MATRIEAQTIATSAEGERAASASFQRFGGFCAILAGVFGFLYAVAFVVLPRVAPNLGDTTVALYSLFLMLGGVATTAALVALYYRLRETDTSFALWGLWLGLIGALGAIIHGGYDLGKVVNPPSVGAATELPNQVDPRGLLTFGVASLGLFVMSWLLSRNAHFPKNFAYLGYLSAALMMVLYLGRLIILDATNPIILVAAALAGFIVNPAWYVWLGLQLRKNT